MRCGVRRSERRDGGGGGDGEGGQGWKGGGGCMYLGITLNIDPFAMLGLYSIAVSRCRRLCGIKGLKSMFRPRSNMLSPHQRRCRR